MIIEKYKVCIDACNDCAIACDLCTIEDLKGPDVKMLAECIRIARECAAFCRATAHIMGIDGKFAKYICSICAEACDSCADECEKQSHMEHCQACAIACKICANECRKFVGYAGIRI